MKIKTQDLVGAALDWAVCACFPDASGMMRQIVDQTASYIAQYSTNWALAGPIIEREFIELRPGSYTGRDRLWAAWSQNRHGDRAVGRTGATPLIAAMRCFVASKLGDEVDVPDKIIR